MMCCLYNLCHYDVMHSVRTFGVSDLVPRVVVVLSFFKVRISFHILSLKFCYFHCEM